MHETVNSVPDLATRVSPVDVSTLQERVYQSIRLALLRGGFEPGESISIRAMAKAYGTSPMPVREALQRLVAAKALVQTPDRLIRVAPFTREIHEEHIRIRIQIEGYATERACLGRNVGLISRLTSLNREMLDAALAHDVESAVAANQTFHFAIYEAAGYPQLLDIISTLWLRSGPFVATARRAPGDARTIFETGFKAHKRIIEAINSRNRKRARYAMGVDIRTATKWLENNYDFTEDTK